MRKACKMLLIVAISLIALLNCMPVVSAQEVTLDCGEGVSCRLDLSTGNLYFSGDGRFYEGVSIDDEFLAEVKSVYISAEVSDMNFLLFIACCDNISEIITDKNNQYFMVGKDGVLFTKDGKTLLKMPALNGVESYAIPNTVTESIPFAFYGNKTLTSVTLSNGMTTISEEMFGRCTKLTTVVIPETVTKIENCAFQNCTSLREIILPDSVKTMDFCAFSNCENLESVTFSKNVTEIGPWVFNSTTSLRDVYYSGTESDFQKISVSAEDNEALFNARIHYNHNNLSNDSVAAEVEKNNPGLVESIQGDFSGRLDRMESLELDDSESTTSAQKPESGGFKIELSPFGIVTVILAIGIVARVTIGFAASKKKNRNDSNQ